MADWMGSGLSPGHLVTQRMLQKVWSFRRRLRPPSKQSEVVVPGRCPGHTVGRKIQARDKMERCMKGLQRQLS